MYLLFDNRRSGTDNITPSVAGRRGMMPEWKERDSHHSSIRCRRRAVDGSHLLRVWAFAARDREP
jgi:hypothetical protein